MCDKLIAEFGDYSGYDCMSAAWTIRRQGFLAPVIAVLDCKTHKNDPAVEYYAHVFAASIDLLKAAKKALEECCDLISTPAGDALQAAIDKAESKEKA